MLDTEETKGTTQPRGQRGRGNKGPRGANRPARGGEGAPRGGERGRGGRGYGRGGKKFESNQNEESKQGRPQTKNGKDGKEHRDNRNQRKGRAPKDAPKDSYFYKFHYGPWPEHENIEVKIDTELPPQIPKEERLQDPLKDEYTKNMQHLDDEIKSLIEKIKEINKEKDQVFKRGIEEAKAKIEGEDLAKEEGKSFKDLVAERNGHLEKKREIDAQSKKDKDRLDQVQTEIRIIMKNINPKCKTVEKVTERIKEINKTIQTETINAKQEKDYYKEMTFLEKSKKYVQKLEKIEPELETLKEAVKGYEKKAKVHRKEINKINQILDAKAEENKKRKEISTEKKADLDLLEEKVQKVKAQIKEIEIRKDEAREEYYRRKYEYECQRSQITHVDRLHRRKNDLIKAEEEKKKQEEEKRAQRESMPNPYEDDISTCDFLIRYCRKIAADKEKKETKVQKDSERKEESVKKAEEFQKLADQGKIMFVKPKEDREEMLVINEGGIKGRGKKNKKNKKRPQTAKPEEAKESRDPNELSFKYEIIQSFGEVGVHPPDTIQDLENKIQELEDKRRELFEKGEKKLDQEFLNQGEETNTRGNNETEDNKQRRDQKLNFNAEEADEENWPAMQ